MSGQSLPYLPMPPGYLRGTGFCLYQVQLQSDGGGLRVTHALVNRESGQGSGMSDDEDRDIIRLLLLELAALEH